jgi:hypothetical protein
MKLKNVPTQLSDITLEQAQKVLLLDQNPDMEDFPKMVHSVAIMTGHTPHEIGQVHLVDLENVYNRIFSMIEGGGLEAPLRRHVNYLGREYAFIEDVRDMETGAFVDIDEMVKDDRYAENLHKIMAVLYRPVDAKIGKRYKLTSYVKEHPKDREERQAVFLKHMTLDVVRGAAGFFLAVMLKSLNISGNSFPTKRVGTEMTAILGGGITSFTP